MSCWNGVHDDNSDYYLVQSYFCHLQGKFVIPFFGGTDRKKRFTCITF